jgi:hypothetical protein
VEEAAKALPLKIHIVIDRIADRICRLPIAFADCTSTL